MDDVNLAILVDAKKEYTKQLMNTLCPNILLDLKSIYKEVKNECIENKNVDNSILKLHHIPIFSR